MGATAATPDNVGWGTIPGDRLSDYASAFRWCCHISTDVMESLSVGRASICLRDISASHYFFKRACWWKVRKNLFIFFFTRTEMDLRAFCKLFWPRAAIMTLAPLPASWRAAARPSPFEPPVMRIVWNTNYLVMKWALNEKGCHTRPSTGNSFLDKMDPISVATKIRKL